jgi:hypothetical protein
VLCTLLLAWEFFGANVVSTSSINSRVGTLLSCSKDKHVWGVWRMNVKCQHQLTVLVAARVCCLLSAEPETQVQQEAGS